MNIIEFTPKDRGLLKKFVKFQWDLYKDDPIFVPELKMELLGNTLLGQTGLLTEKHDYHHHAKTVYYMAYEGKRIVGRIAATVNHPHNDYYKEKTGFCGFFECIDDPKVAHALFDKAVAFLKAEGMDTVRGPANFSSNETWGLLIQNFTDPIVMQTPYNKTYYEKLFDSYGFQKKKDLVAYMLDIPQEGDDRTVRVEKIVNHRIKKMNITFRNVNLKKMKDEIAIMHSLYNDSWSSNWGYIPMSLEEFTHAAVNLKLIADPNIITFAFIDGEPVGFQVNVPNTNEMIPLTNNALLDSDLIRSLRLMKNKRKFTIVRMMLTGVKATHRKLGLDSIIILQNIKGSWKNPMMKKCEMSWMLEDNYVTLQEAAGFGGVEYRRWRVYDKAI